MEPMLNEQKVVYYRCQECDYLGTIMIENEDGDCCCPECGGDCNEFEPMTEEEHALVHDFICNNKDHFIYPENHTYNESDLIDDLIDIFCWESSQEVIKKIKEMEKLKKEVYVYSVVTGADETAYIFRGWCIVNNIGHFLTSKEISLPDGSIRFW